MTTPKTLKHPSKGCKEREVELGLMKPSSLDLWVEAREAERRKGPMQEEMEI